MGGSCIPEVGQLWRNEMSGDYMVRATAADMQIRAFAVTGAGIVETARRAHDSSPVVTAALGRLLMAGVMMGSTLKSESDLLTLTVAGDGPAGNICVTAGCDGNVKGYADNPQAINPPRYDHKLDVGGIVGNGTLRVIKDMGLKEPYVGQVALITGEIAEDITYYYATSEQIPSSVALGVLMNKDNTVKRAGGFMIQLMPGAGDEVISKLEERLKEISSITALLDEGLTPEDILDRLLGDMGLAITEKDECRFYCNCSKDRFAAGLVSLGKKELKSLLDEGKSIEVGCHFCGKKYEYSVGEIQALYDRAVR